MDVGGRDCVCCLHSGYREGVLAGFAGGEERFEQLVDDGLRLIRGSLGELLEEVRDARVREVHGLGGDGEDAVKNGSGAGRRRGILGSVVG